VAKQNPFCSGGSFTGGSSSEALFDGQYIAEEQDVILVSINYRLNIFGFPGNPASEFNLGILDQRMAIEWVRDNIARFGGDPNRIVLCGQSAGAASVDMHSYAYAQDPIASGFVLQSGTAWGFGLQTQSAAADLWYLAAQAVGCNNGNTTVAKVFTCMMSVPSSVLIEYLPPIDYGETPGLPYGPVIDGKLVFETYSNLTPAARPMLVGNTNDESGLSEQLTPPWSGLPSWYWPVQNVYVFTCPAGERAAISIANGIPAWRYRWYGVWPNTLIPWINYTGAWHGSEVCFHVSNMVVLVSGYSLIAVTAALDFQHSTSGPYSQYGPRKRNRKIHARRMGSIRQRPHQGPA
jgi:cholinesterase